MRWVKRGAADAGDSPSSEQAPPPCLGPPRAGVGAQRITDPGGEEVCRAEFEKVRQGSGP